MRRATHALLFGTPLARLRRGWALVLAGALIAKSS
jgi:hypothetical protein